MEKLKMHSPNLTNANIEKIKALFPNCITESQDENGNLKLAVDFDQLRQELSDSIVEGPQERYHLNWPGKREALLTANAPIAKTLRPAPDESVDFENTKNLFIEGDNLEALKLLQETYLGKVKMIYIDPPYNTGNDFVYEDDFAEDAEQFLLKSNQKDEAGNRLVANTESNGRFHSDWLDMIYPRLKLARNLLADNGVVFISIDDSEIHNLRKVCDEVFGDDNFICSATRRRRKSQANLTKNISTIHEYVLIYQKTNNANLNKISGDIDKNKYSNPDNDPRGPYVTMPCTNKGGAKYIITTPTGTTIEEEWRFKKETYDKLEQQNKLVFPRGGDGKPRYKLFLSEKLENGVIPNSWWENISSNQEATSQLKELFLGANFFDFPKPVDLLKLIIELGSGAKDDIILDFFAGSASTAHAVMQMNAEDGGNRKFIMVQLPEACNEKSEAFKAGYKNIAEISKERIRRAGKKILEGTCHENWNKDIGFRVLKVDTSNMADVYYAPDGVKQNDLLAAVDNIKPDRKAEDLLFQVLLDWGVDLSLPITRQTIQGKTVFFVDSNALVACFDGGITEELVKEIAKTKALRAVFKDNGFVSDSVKINAVQIFKQISPSTDVKVI